MQPTPTHRPTTARAGHRPSHEASPSPAHAPAAPAVQAPVAHESPAIDALAALSAPAAPSTPAAPNSPASPPAEVAFADAPLRALRPDVRDASKAFNRDLSWLEFNARVLRQAFDERLPLLERTRFLAIFTSNLDEFVMKRVAHLLRCLDSPLHQDHDGQRPKELLRAVRKTFEHLEEQQALVYERSIRPALAREGIELLNWSQLSEGEHERLRAWYRTRIFPALTPLAVDPGHRFPFISNLSNNFGVLMTDPGRDEPLFARVKIPSGQGFPWWVRVPDAAGVGRGAGGMEGGSETDATAPGSPKARPRDPGRGRYVQLHEIIRHNLGDLFPGMTITEVMPFRVTRAAEGSAPPESEEHADSLLEFVEDQLKRRRFAKVVRLEVDPGGSASLVSRVVEMFKIHPADVDPSQGLLDFRSLFQIADLPRPELRAAPWKAPAPARLRDPDASIFKMIRAGDTLVHHPYESFELSTERFIADAAADPNVVAIKQTIYRTSRDSPFIAHLIKAAENGKQVAVLVELRARFDEGRNVRLARALEKAGVHVAYGVVGFKTHCKAALVVRREGEELRCYAHIGTGNYNPTTAQLYTDLGLLTCDPEITSDVAELFNHLTGRSRKKDYRKLLVAPVTMKPSFLELIAQEVEHARRHRAGQQPVGGRIVAKMNALEDATITRALYAASQAGVQIDLFVRGFCCLRPGVPGLSENIRVTSVIGRFLEHSRIFHFANGQAEPEQGLWYIGSADWMYRNLEQRVEAVCPVTSTQGRAKLSRIIRVMDADRRHAWALRPDGRYVPKDPREFGSSPLGELGTFDALMRDAAEA